jgi:1-acyl-sn-glycerol-3-phosphate acyltransferase
MWALAVVGAAAAALVIGWRRSGLPWWHYFEHASMRLFVRLWHRAREVRAPLPAAGPTLVVARHRSNADPAFLMATCARQIRFLQAQEYFDIFLLRRLFALVGIIPVARNGRDVVGLRAALRALHEGAVVCVFPEGDVGAVLAGRARWKSGAALLALRSRAPVYPAIIVGAPQTGCVLQDWLLPSRGAQVRFGPAVDLARYYERRITRGLLNEVTAELARHVELLDPERKHPAPLSRRSA